MPTVIRERKLHRTQANFLLSSAPYRGFCGGIGSGKSWIGAYDLIQRAKPGRMYLACAPTYPMIRDASLRTFRLITEELQAVADFGRDFRKGDMIVVLRNGAEVIFRSTDDPEKLRGPNLSGVWMDEASLMTREAYDVTIGRLREGGEQGWLSATFTPKGKQHWTYEVFGQGAENTALFHARTKDNPFLPRTFDASVRGQYTTALAMQELEGHFMDAPGCLFRRHWFGIVDAAPTGLKRVRAWDLAATEATDANDPDWTAGLLLARSTDGLFYVLDVRHVRDTPRGIERLIRQTAEQDGQDVRIVMEQEPGASGVNLVDHYRRYVLPGFIFQAERATGDKVTRAQPVAAQAEAGNVKLVRAPWNKDYLDEMEVFPQGAHDDQCDATSLALAALTLRAPLTLEVW